MKASRLLSEPVPLFARLLRMIRPVLLAAACAVLIGGCSSAPAPITAHGTVTVDYTSSDDLSDGSQVVIVNSAGTVVGNGTLALKHSGPGLDGLDEEDVFGFTVTVPGGLPRYGIQVNGTRHGTLWDSASQMKSGPGVEIDETAGGL
jgi:hypothetical protein